VYEIEGNHINTHDENKKEIAGKESSLKKRNDIRKKSFILATFYNLK